MLNMITGEITFSLKGISFDTVALTPIEVLGPNTSLSLTVHIWFEE
jgi:hypothetical protein